MWSRLMELFREVPTEDVKSTTAEPIVSELQTEDSLNLEGKSTLMGFNYLKGLDDEKNIDRPRKFINLTKLLRGDYKDG